MPVIGIDQVPRELQRPSFLSDLGYGQGSLERAILLALVSQGRLGQVPTPPTPQRPGTLTFPSGASTPTSPLEMAQIQQRGGVPTQQGITPLQPGGVTYQQPTRLGILPNLERQQTEADIAYKRAQTQSLSPEFQAELLRRYQGLPPQGKGQPSGNEFLQGLSDLSARAQAGDEDAVKRIRIIRQLMQGQ